MVALDPATAENRHDARADRAGVRAHEVGRRRPRNGAQRRAEGGRRAQAPRLALAHLRGRTQVVDSGDGTGYTGGGARPQGVDAVTGWIKFDKDMADDPRLTAAAEALLRRYAFTFATGHPVTGGDALRFARNALLGALLQLWRYADEHLRHGNVLKMSPLALDSIVGLEGFCELMPVEWLVVDLDHGTIELPRYCEKNAVIARRRAAEHTKARQARWRARQADLKQKLNGVHNADSNALLARLQNGRTEQTLKTKTEVSITSPKSVTSVLSERAQPDPKTVSKRETKRRAVATLVKAVAAEKGIP